MEVKIPWSEDYGDAWVLSKLYNYEFDLDKERNKRERSYINRMLREGGHLEPVVSLGLKEIESIRTEQEFHIVTLKDDKDYGLVSYDETLQLEQPWVTISKITVPTEYDKKQLLKAFEYIHDLRNINTDLLAVNTICHLYLNPELIEVSGIEPSKGTGVI
jgi:hypothetical protein